MVVHTDGLVRALLVEDSDELIEPGLLLQEVLARGLGGFFLERQVHAFVATVLLWVSGLDALDANAYAQPPHRELGEAEEGAAARERNAIVAADGAGEAKFLEGALEDGKSILFLGAVQSLAT